MWPFFTEPEYLCRSYLKIELFAVSDSQFHILLGKGVVSLKKGVQQVPLEFTCNLSLEDEFVGSLGGCLQGIYVPDQEIAKYHHVSSVKSKAPASLDATENYFTINSEETDESSDEVMLSPSSSSPNDPSSPTLSLGSSLDTTPTLLTTYMTSSDKIPLDSEKERNNNNNKSV